MRVCAARCWLILPNVTYVIGDESVLAPLSLS